MNKTIGATLLVAGTTVGAGMLALPTTLANFGVIGTIIFLTLFWLVMYSAGIVFMDINLGYSKSYSISAIAEMELGIFAKIIASICYFGLLYALLAAYTVGMLSICSNLFESYLAGINRIVLSLIITVPLAALICCNIDWLDLFNRGIFVIKILIFLLIALGLVMELNPDLLEFNIAKIEFYALPVIFTSFGFHGSIPSVMNYLENDRKSIKTAFFWGSLIPLIVYISWCIIVYGVIPRYGNNSFESISDAKSDVGFFIQTLNNIVNAAWLNTAISSFSFLAIVTSFLGVGIGLYDSCSEIIQSKINNKAKASSIIIATTFIPPFIFALYYPSGFIAALHYAAIALCIFAVLIPSLVALKKELKLEVKSYFKIFNLCILLIIGIVIISIDRLV